MGKGIATIAIIGGAGVLAYIFLRRRQGQAVIENTPNYGINVVNELQKQTKYPFKSLLRSQGGVLSKNIIWVIDSKGFRRRLLGFSTDGPLSRRWAQANGIDVKSLQTIPDGELILIPEGPSISTESIVAQEQLQGLVYKLV